MTGPAGGYSSPVTGPACGVSPDLGLEYPPAGTGVPLPGTEVPPPTWDWGICPLGLVTQQAVCLLWFPAEGLSCFF